MNWIEIENKCPKAYYQCELWVHEELMPINEKSTIPPDLNQINDRDLYDFFDENGLRLAIIPCSIGWYCQLHEMGISGSLYLSKMLVFEIECKKVLVADTRIEAETAAFEKAFAILEDRLNN